jgi:hypothetical protein
MTRFEKVMSMMTDENGFKKLLIKHFCPQEYGMKDESANCAGHAECEECWNRGVDGDEK